MKSSYRKIGDYIQLVDERNKGLKVQNLLGLSISKQFIPSVANIIGTDMENYKIIRRNQFACSTMQVRRDKKMPVALLQEVDEAIISQAYPVFEVKDEKELLPEYLMMWFARSEFDREACFNAVGGVRGSLEWEDFENMQLPIPHIAKQREIVKEYNVIQNRITLNQQLIQKLEETAQAIYREWFVENAESWNWTTVKDFCIDMKSGGTPSRTENSYWNSNDIPWIKTGEIKNNILIQAEEFISNEGLKNSSAKLLPKDTVLMSMYGVNAGDIGVLKFEATTNQACCGMICKNPMQAAFLYYHLLHNQKFIATQAIGGAQENLSKDFVEKIEIPMPDDDKLNSNILKTIIDNKEIYTRQNQKLSELKELLLSKLATA
ncbi:MAG: restriction endonuclease subunit S [Paludibacter sp.]|nr:restriction endonuclease subunit S [Paludibacter sp.]